MRSQDPQIMADTDICIIGAGLSGLALACTLTAMGREVTVLESRDRPGGRVLTQMGHDLGPAWIWPHNHRMLALLKQLNLRTFPQYATGKLVFEAATGPVRRDLDMAMMGGALRVDGGLARVTDALAARLGAALRLGCCVTSLTPSTCGVCVTTDHGTLQAKAVVLCLPPRLAAGLVGGLTEGLTGGLGVAVPDVPTWMAGQAKLVAIYPSAFWRSAHLNGDAISHRGPLVEVHDASPNDAATGALFGFARHGAASLPDFTTDALAQLARLFGPDAATPTQVIVKDWSIDPATATLADTIPLTSHPVYRPLPPLDRVIFAGSEAAPEDGGFLEGALAAAEAALVQLRTAQA